MCGPLAVADLSGRGISAARCPSTRDSSSGMTRRKHIGHSNPSCQALPGGENIKERSYESGGVLVRCAVGPLTVHLDAFVASLSRSGTADYVSVVQANDRRLEARRDIVWHGR